MSLLSNTGKKPKDSIETGLWESRQSYQVKEESPANNDKIIDSTEINFPDQTTSDSQTKETDPSRSGFEVLGTEETLQAEVAGNNEKVNFENFQQATFEAAPQKRDVDIISSDTSLPFEEKVISV
ncbi:hypothetical protein Gasu2_37600 [Galdieria sulphuraria]|uniref:Uncharacterized protein n=1 Tax=Galdieria sulphuraria TaxID=130081 RepID=M2XUQ8_GALSU|nr:uncharacterized protein Gasu_50870 [Galdieria sulphuraria]EME27358.1 hypothetical protein Gasu_50870 [Galdieria sulphuraria]GJD09513.1 hypothetical protein Gasu2_37600 [Galdieria sulphuraria]|eukprot:XP_005703878.1 hypothetical protein Gasu_50870 [Galdieria sulphuraria]